MSPGCALLAWTLLTLLRLGAAQEELTSCGPIVPRREWGALASTCERRLNLPACYVVVSHMVGSPETPPPRAAAQSLLACGVALGALRRDYEVKGHGDVQHTLSPGDQLYRIIQTWPHYQG
ncbi:hypothetical protein HPG69_018245 [Diceros bicornis minor]|uniref:Peptidoglycan recognition protein family domain-containing protein n=1 Tax=Diceros bicornis minor TaxID=77932 RepID=A0A7J7E467_DICBM|nr:hypothetical protein HPG69_018245 [Diceros bicornis minor]